MNMNSAWAWMPIAGLTQKRLNLLAGNPGYENGSATLDGAGSNARFGSPYSITTDAQDNLYVVDIGGTCLVRKITPNGFVTTIAGGSGKLDGTGLGARFTGANGLVYDPFSGNFYVADTGNHAIRKMTPNGVVTTLAGTMGSSGSADGTGASARFNNPGAVTTDSTGNVFVVDTLNSSIRKVTSAGVVTTFAGGGANGSADGTGASAKFFFPRGIAVDSSNNLYVADSGNHTIRKITPGAVVTTLAGLAGSSGSADGTGASARFNSPYGVAVDGSGNIFVADTSNHTIRKITSGGTVTTFVGTPKSSGAADGTGSIPRFNNPHALSFDSSGNLYVADASNYEIRKVTPAGVVTTLAGVAPSFSGEDGTGTAARFNGPQGLAFDASDNIYVADGNNDTVRKITSAGVVTTVAGLAGFGAFANGTGSNAYFLGPVGIVTTSSGNILVADSSNQMIRQVTPAGVVTTFAGSGSTGSADGTGAAAKFNFPTDIAIDSGDNTYVADSNGETIRKITAAGVVTTLAGKYVTAGSADGTGSAARFNGPRGIAVNNTNGDIYVADSGSNTIRKVTQAGVVTTLAGAYATPGTADGTGAAARFNTPRGLVLDGSGNLYIADYGNRTIRKMTAAGVVTTPFGTPTVQRADDGNGNGAGFGGPVGVAFDSHGNLFVTDSTNTNIRKITPSGDVTTFAGYQKSHTGYVDGAIKDARFNSPRSLAFDHSGNIFVTDNGNLVIRKISRAGIVSAFAGQLGMIGSADGTGAAARFNGPYGIVADSSNNLFVSESSNGCIRKITPAGVVTLFAGMPGTSGSADGTGTAARFGTPRGIAIDSSDNLYMADETYHMIRKISPAGVVTTLAGAGTAGSADGTGTSAKFTGPTDVAVDAGGNVYVADASNYTVRKITPGGVVTTLAGTAAQSGYANGTGPSIRFYQPTSVTVDSAGNVFVTDNSNYAIRKISPAGVSSTVIGGIPSSGGVMGTQLISLPAGVTKPTFIKANNGKLYITTTDAILVVPEP